MTTNNILKNSQLPETHARRRIFLSGFLANISIARKMILMVSVLFLGILGTTVSAYVGLQSLRYQFSNIYDFMLIPITSIEEADTALAESQYYLVQVPRKDITAGERANGLAQIQADNQSAEQIIARYDTEWVTTASPQFTKDLKNAGKLELQQQEVAVLASYHTAYNAYKTAAAAYLATVQAGNPNAALATETIQKLETARAELHKLININKQLADFSNISAQAAFQQALLTGSIVLGISVMLGILMSYLIVISITGRLGDLTDNIASMQAGDFDQIVAGRDEISLLGTTFNKMAAQSREFIATLEQRVADRTKALAISSEISRRLSTILDQKELVTEVVNQVKDAFGYYHTQIYFYDDTNEKLVMAGGTGKAGEMMLAQFHKVAKGRGLVGRAAEGNQAVLVSDTSQDADWLPNPSLPETKSEVAIPISIGKKVLGVLDVQHNITDGLQQEDVDSLQSIANQVAVALQNIRQYENTRKIAADMGVVANVGIATSTITEAERLLQEVVDLSKNSFNLYHAHIYLLNETNDILELSAGAGKMGRQMVSEKHAIPLDSEQSLVARAARTQEGVVVNNVTAAPDFLPNPLLPNTRSEMAVPMIVAGKVVGVLDVQSEIVNRFTEVDISIQTTLASQVAVALQNARSFSQTQRQATRETAVNLITQKIQNATTVEAALQIAARELGHALGMKQTLVALDPDAMTGEQKGAHMTDQQSLPKEIETMGTGVSK